MSSKVKPSTTMASTAGLAAGLLCAGATGDFAFAQGRGSCAIQIGAATYAQVHRLPTPIHDPDNSASVQPMSQPILWTTADRLMPAWGFYQVAPSGFGDVGDSLGPTHNSAWSRNGGGTLTWIVNPTRSKYDVWARVSCSSCQIKVKIDDQRIGTPMVNSGNRFTWIRLGQYENENPALRYVDIKTETRGGASLIDAILFSSRADFNPNNVSKPPGEGEITEPVVRSQRIYRLDDWVRDNAAESQRLLWVYAQSKRYDEDIDDWHVPSGNALPTLELWGAPNQYIDGSFEIVAGYHGAEVEVSLEQVVSDQGMVIGKDDIDVRVAKTLPLFSFLDPTGSPRPLAKILLRDDRSQSLPHITGTQGGFGADKADKSSKAVSRIAAGNNRMFWITIHLPEKSPAGRYTGVIKVKDLRRPCLVSALALEIEVLPIELQTIQGLQGIFHLPQTTSPGADHYVGSDKRSTKQYEAELEDQVRHGLNGTTLYGGFSQTPFAEAAGFTGPLIHGGRPDNTGEDPVSMVDRARREMGFADYYFFSKDEPHGADIETFKNDLMSWRKSWPSLHIAAGINDPAAFDVLKDLLNRPILSIPVFGKNDADYVKSRDFIPISTWTVGDTYPLKLRAFAGLYNRAQGFEGTIPWSYNDAFDQSCLPNNCWAVTYPDDNGRPITTRNWEAFRAGSDDVRYLQALDRAIESAHTVVDDPKSRKDPKLAKALTDAEDVRKSRFADLGQPADDLHAPATFLTYYLMALQESELEETRRAFADAIVSIQNNLRRHPRH